jgi:hypothetical protein
LPKKGLDSALSAHTCSLSANSAEFCLLTMTGACQLAWSATVAAVSPVDAGPSMRDTAIASKPLKPCRPGKLEVRLA